MILFLARLAAFVLGFSGQVDVVAPFWEWRLGFATGFAGVGDPSNPNPRAACLRRDLDDATDVVVAHRTLPCLSEVVVCLLGTLDCVRAKVGDRLGRCSHGGCSEVDLAPAAVRRLGRRWDWTGSWRSVYHHAIVVPISARK